MPREHKKQPHTIKTLWFDLGNVILPFDFTKAFQRLARFGTHHPRDMRKFFMDRPYINDDSDEGRLHSYQLYRLLKRRFSLKHLSYGDFKNIWNDIFTVNKMVVRLLERLKKSGYRLVLISNTNKLHYDHIRESYPFMSHFDKVILSYKEKSQKPKKAIYRIALKHSKAKAHEIFYTDDRAELIQAAKENHGVHAHVFKNYAGLRHALRKIEVL